MIIRRLIDLSAGLGGGSSINIPWRSRDVIHEEHTDWPTTRSRTPGGALCAAFQNAFATRVLRRAQTDEFSITAGQGKFGAVGGIVDPQGPGRV